MNCKNKIIKYSKNEFKKFLIKNNIDLQSININEIWNNIFIINYLKINKLLKTNNENANNMFKILLLFNELIKNKTHNINNSDITLDNIEKQILKELKNKYSLNIESIYKYFMNENIYKKITNIFTNDLFNNEDLYNYVYTLIMYVDFSYKYLIATEEEKFIIFNLMMLLNSHIIDYLRNLFSDNFNLIIIENNIWLEKNIFKNRK